MSTGPPLVIGRYRIVREIARSSSATVYLALDTQQQRHVALKVIPLRPDASNAAAIVQRFRREAQIAVRLSGHPHIAAVLDVGQSDRALYIAMEYIEGIGLDRRVGTPLDLRFIVKVVAAVARALDAAHAARIVHRKLKPADILLGKDGRIILTDFGMAGLLDSQGPLTKRGTIVGTPAYLAPEVVLGQAYSPASDQYALAAIAYELLTGQPPFQGPNAVAVAHAHVRETAAPPSALRRGLPPDIDAVLARAMAKTPRERYTNCLEFAEALAAALGERLPDAGASMAPGGAMAAPTPRGGTPRSPTDIDRRGRGAPGGGVARAGSEPVPQTPGGDLDDEAERRLSERYERAVFHVRAQDWATARDLLNSIYAEQPAYRDVAELRQQVADELVKRWEKQARIQESHERQAAKAHRAQQKASPWTHIEGQGKTGDAGAQRDAAAKGGMRVQRRLADDESLEIPQLQNLVARYEAAVAAADERDWVTAIYLLESIERSIPELVRANRRLLLGTAQPTTPLQKRAPKIYEVMDLLKRGRALLGGPGEHPGLISYRKALNAAAQVTGDAGDGSFTVKVEGNQLMLTIEGAREGGRAVTLPEIEAELSQWPLAELDRDALAAALAGQAGQPVAVGVLRFTYRETSGPAADLGVVVTDDEMRAYLVPTERSIEADLTPQDVHAVLANAGVTFGLQAHAIEQFANQRPRAFPTTVAIGHAPEPGSPWRIVVCVDTVERGGQTTVKRGAPLLRVEQDEPGVPGRTVTGREVAPESEPPPDLAPYAGPGTKVAEDGRSVIASEAGIVAFEGHRAKIELPESATRPVERPSDEATRQKGIVPGRPVFGPGNKWVEISALNAQVAKARAAELLGTAPEELEAREIGGAGSRWRSSESSWRHTTKRYRVQPRSIHGRFELHGEPDGLYLTVWPPEGGGRPVTTAQLQAALAQWPATRVTEAQLDEILRRQSSEPVRISPPAWLAVPCGAGHLGVILAEDEMSADVVPLGSLRQGVLDEGTVRAALAQAGVRYGIVNAELTRFCRLEERSGLYRLAVGTAPGDIIDEPEYLFPRDERPAPDVRPGTMLAWARTEPATPGRTVTGKVVLADSSDRRPLSDFIGEGTAIEARPGVPGGYAVVAAAEGRPTVIGGRITVLKHEYVAEPVEGTVAFEGSATLAAASNGAVVRARGDLTLESDAEEVTLEAGGSVRLRGVEGHGKARIQSGENVVASWLRGCLIMVRDTIHVGSLLAQSTIMSARRVVVRGEGTIRGGLVRATEEIVAQRILAGDEGNPTRIVLGRLRRGKDEASHARLIVHGEIEAGVRISIDGATLEVTEPIRRAILRQREGIIHVEPLVA